MTVEHRSKEWDFRDHVYETIRQNPSWADAAIRTILNAMRDIMEPFVIDEVVHAQRQRVVGDYVACGDLADCGQAEIVVDAPDCVTSDC